MELNTFYWLHHYLQSFVIISAVQNVSSVEVFSQITCRCTRMLYCTRAVVRKMSSHWEVGGNPKEAKSWVLGDLHLTLEQYMGIMSVSSKQWVCRDGVSSVANLLLATVAHCNQALTLECAFGLCVINRHPLHLFASCCWRSCRRQRIKNAVTSSTCKM